MPTRETTGLPGYRSDRTAAYRRIRKSDQGAQYLEGGILINGSKSGDALNTGNVDVLRPGNIMVKEASGGLYRNFIIGVSGEAYDTDAGADTTLEVAAAVATEIARLITVAGGAVTLSLIGPPTAAGTVAATDIVISAASGTTLTITDIAVDKVTNSLITAHVPATSDITDGTFCFIDDGTGVKLSDVDGNRITQEYGHALVAGSIDESQIVNWPADTSTRTYLKNLLNQSASGYGFRFDGPAVA